MDAIKEAKGWMEVHGGVSPIALSTQIIGRLIAEVEKLEAECKERVAEKMEWLTERNELQSSLTRSKTEGRREGMEDLVCYMIDNCERETITEEYLQGVLSDCIRFFDIAAAIRQQAVQEGKE